MLRKKWEDVIFNTAHIETKEKMPKWTEILVSLHILLQELMNDTKGSCMFGRFFVHSNCKKLSQIWQLGFRKKKKLMPLLTGSHSITSLSPALAKEILKRKNSSYGQKFFWILTTVNLQYVFQVFISIDTIRWPLKLVKIFEGLGNAQSNLTICDLTSST